MAEKFYHPDVPADLAPMFEKLADALSYEGIAADLNIGVGTVKSRLSRARAQMNRLIEEDAADANAGNA